MTGNGSRNARTDGGTAEEWRVGSASRVITPEESLFMSGFAARTEPSDGTMMDIHTKAIAFEDDGDDRAVVASTEILFVPKSMRETLERRIEDEYGIDPDALVLNATHTHYGPEIREMRYAIYGVDEDLADRGRAYRERLVDDIVEAVGEALDALEPAELRYGHARCGIAMNRRYPTETGVHFRQHPDGPVDTDVPVLAAYRDDDPETILFGYACHPTCLPAITEYSGDWAGHAMANLEEHYDGATAVFVQGCGGDIKAYPQNDRELSEQHGQTLSNSVRAALDAPTEEVHGPLRSVYEHVTVELESPPPREELEADLDSNDEYRRRHARLLLDQLDEHGEILTEYEYPVQALGFGDDLTLLAMAGETLVDYSLELKELLDGTVWPLGYTNADFTYVPTKRARYEGGYEGGGMLKYTAFPGPPKPDTEERVIETALALAERVGRRRTDVNP